MPVPDPLGRLSPRARGAAPGARALARARSSRGTRDDEGSVDYRSFITTGRFGPLAVSDPWDKVVATLGACADYGEDEWGTGYATYGCVDMTVSEGAVLTIKLTLRPPQLDDPTPAPPPAAVELRGFDEPELGVAEVERLLAAAGVEWRRLDRLCDATTTYYQTAAGVHIQFERGRVLAVCAQGLFDGWVESA